jgi:hypothetical protein
MPAPPDPLTWRFPPVIVNAKTLELTYAYPEAVPSSIPSPLPDPDPIPAPSSPLALMLPPETVNATTLEWKKVSKLTLGIVES